MAYPNWVFSLFSLIGFLLCCIPFPWHLEAWNTGTCLYMAWTGLGCLNFFINSIVWNGNAVNWAPVWCDISTKYAVGLNVAIPAASLCINRRLYNIASVRTVTITRAEKRRQILIDLAIGLGLPILEMILHYIPQGHRFNILEDVGCFPHTYGTWVAFVIVNTPPVAIGLVSGAYAILSIRAFYKTRAQSKEMLSAYSNLTSSRYFRLMALAATDVIFTVPLGIYVIVNNARGQIPPWISWADTHWGFSRVDQIPAMLWRANSRQAIGIEMFRWSTVICAIIFFLYFGFADEAIKNYRSAVSSVAKRVGISTGSFGNSTGLYSTSESVNRMSRGGAGSHPGSIPVFGREKYGRKNFDEESFSDASSDTNNVPPTPIDSKKNMSFTNLFSAKKNLHEEVLKPNFQYNDLVLPDIGGTLATNDSSDDVLTIPSSGASSASSVSVPEPAVTRSSAGGAEIASVRRAHPADVPLSVSVPEDLHRHSHDMV
ncbi:Pheromone B alpha 3 receptor [Leucoagaricus sp. SymC.cos]|nr:Pheromone B alpha 3 receptor [Leucoagaricus sp. SymC.cos]